MKVDKQQRIKKKLYGFTGLKKREKEPSIKMPMKVWFVTQPQRFRTSSSRRDKTQTCRSSFVFAVGFHSPGL